MRLPLLLLWITVVLLGLAACGEDDEQESAPAPAAEAADPPAATATPSLARLRELFADISKDLGEKPSVPTPQGAPPDKLVMGDIVRGKGRSAKAGDRIAVQYVGASWSDGRQFDASWDRGREPFVFPLGAGQVIPGWDQGLMGMKEGGRRVLVIPPELAYGEAGAPPDIAPGETLIFVVDLVKIRR